MKAYFSQFGHIKRLRLSRNKRTGKSKHYAFIEFASADVADIVARTMNNYLLFQRILQVRVVPSSQIHEDLWKGAGKRFNKPAPRNAMFRKELEHGTERKHWENRVEKEEKKRLGKAEKAKSVFGYEFEAPKVRTVESVPVRAKAVEAA
jgi:nucleolar protein 15